MSLPVLFVVGDLEWGGVQRQFLSTLDRFDGTGLDPSLAVWSPPLDVLAEVERRQVPVQVAPATGRLAKLRWLRRLVMREAPVIVHALSHYTNAAVALAALGTPAAAVGSVVNDPRAARRRDGVLVGEAVQSLATR